MVAACAPEVADKAQAPVKEQAAMKNPVFHFEIPVTELDRAIAFYEDVFGYQLTREDVDGYDMAFFPRAGDAPGASGALAKGDVYRPSHDGPVI
jgi:predicted enzyme related to lactoylglutathione lyase